MIILWLVPVVILLGGMAWANWRLRHVARLVDDLAQARRSSAALSAALGGLRATTTEVTALLDETGPQ